MAQILSDRGRHTPSGFGTYSPRRATDNLVWSVAFVFADAHRYLEGAQAVPAKLHSPLTFGTDPSPRPGTSGTRTSRGNRAVDVLNA